MDTEREGSTERRILTAIRRIIRAVDLYSRRLMEKYGLTGPQLATLREIARRGSIRAGAAAGALRVSQPTMTGILERLERNGLVTRTRNGRDRRAVDVGITEAGRRILQTAPPLLEDRLREKLAALPEAERSSVLAVLQHVAAMLDAEGLDASPHLVIGSDRL